jgi:phytoene dehydrogenase-like protein
MAAAYDAVVIGAGVNGLTLALYLQRAGLVTLVVEKAARVGGMARTEEPFGPGLRHNPHANYLAYGAVSPVERDFDLGGAGLATVTPEAQHGMAFADGRPPLILHRNDLTHRSGASLAAYSARDARTYTELKAAVNGLDPLMAAALYAPLRRETVQRQAEVAARLVGRDVTARSAREVIDALFEADEVRAFFYQLAAETGLLVEAPGSAVGFLTFTLWLVGQWRMPVGGMQAFPDALLRRARETGVDVATGAVVERILVRGGKAAAVIVAGRGQVVARRAVASSAGLAATLLGFLPEAALSAGERVGVRAYAAQDGPGLASLVLGLAVAPDYRSARHDPAINRCFRTVIGYEDATGTLAHLREVGAGFLPAPAAALRVNSLWDPSQAPPGLHVAAGDVLMPAAGALDPQAWSEVADGFPDAFLAAWSRYAPNVTAATASARRFEPPRSYDRALRLREGAGQYRTEVARLYLCGASTYPGGGVHGACGFNAFQAIAEDLGLPGPPAPR